jgi:hypothetical protein
VHPGIGANRHPAAGKPSPPRRRCGTEPTPFRVRAPGRSTPAARAGDPVTSGSGGAASSSSRRRRDRAEEWPLSERCPGRRRAQAWAAAGESDSWRWFSYSYPCFRYTGADTNASARTRGKIYDGFCGRATGGRAAACEVRFASPALPVT